MGKLTVRLRRGLAGCVAALATASAACSPTAAEEVTLVDPQVIPANVDGRLVGCDISFHLARGYTGQRFDRAIGATLSLYATDEMHWVGALKVGVQPGLRVVQPPESAFLVTPTGTNEAEVARQLTLDGGYIGVTFSGGPSTNEAFETLADRGAALIRLRMPNRDPEDWTLDLRGRPEIRAAWSRCLSEMQLPVTPSETPSELEQAQ